MYAGATKTVVAPPERNLACEPFCVFLHSSQQYPLTQYFPEIKLVLIFPEYLVLPVDALTTVYTKVSLVRILRLDKL